MDRKALEAIREGWNSDRHQNAKAWMGCWKAFTIMKQNKKAFDVIMNEETLQMWSEGIALIELLALLGRMGNCGLGLDNLAMSSEAFFQQSLNRLGHVNKSQPAISANSLTLQDIVAVNI